MRLCAVILHKVLHDVGQARNLSRKSSARESPRTTVDTARYWGLLSKLQLAELQLRPWEAGCRPLRSWMREFHRLRSLNPATCKNHQKISNQKLSNISSNIIKSSTHHATHHAKQCLSDGVACRCSRVQTHFGPRPASSRNAEPLRRRTCRPAASQQSHAVCSWEHWQIDKYPKPTAKRQQLWPTVGTSEASAWS